MSKESVGSRSRLTCPCGASASDTSKERGRFKRRHPKDPARLEHHLEVVKRKKVQKYEQKGDR